MIVYSFIKKIDNYKNSKGESSPYCIVSHNTSKVLSSYKTKEEANAYLIQMSKYRKNSILQINSKFSVIRHENKIPGGIGDNFDLNTIPKDELIKGMEVESEHSPDPAIQLDIIADHEKETVDKTGEPNYYEYLDKMESNMK